jgi:hypothetical protein
MKARIHARSPAQAGATKGGRRLPATVGGDWPFRRERGRRQGPQGHGGDPVGGDGMDDVREGAWEDAIEGPHELGGSWVE